MPGADARFAESLLRLSDDALLGQCDVDLYRASGPGGQKRNKTSSAVRLRHRPTGLIVTAVESRSQHENRARACRRLREAIAFRQRNAWTPSQGVPAYYADVLQQSPGLHITTRHAEYLLVAQHVLDVLHACSGSTAEAAAHLAISTGQLIRYLKADSGLWQEANRLRVAFGHHALK